MANTNITSLRKNLYSTIDSVIKYNEVINVSTKDGNAVIISEEDYNNMIATIEFSSNQKLKQKLLDGKNTKITDCIGIDEVKW